MDSNALLNKLRAAGVTANITLKDYEAAQKAKAEKLAKDRALGKV